MEYPLPPILRVRGMKLLSMGEDAKGIFLKFGATRNKIREVTVYMMAPGKIKWEYVYSIWDPETKTVTTYQGHYGDPTKDVNIDIRGA